MTSNHSAPTQERDGNRTVSQLVRLMTVTAWTTLIIGVVLCAFNLAHFSDQNASLMIGIGFMIASVHIYLIRTALHLVKTSALPQ